MIAVVTIVAGRHDHLQLQLEGVAANVVRPDLHVVVAMGDAEIAGVVGDRATVVSIDRVGGRLPLAAARNLGAATALRAGADLLVFLDVDCVPDTGCVQAYRDAVLRYPDDVLSGQVGYLPQPPSGGYRLAALSELAELHAARPSDVVGAQLPHELIWSLSFAVTAAGWRHAGGFDEVYVGYGGEDTDFGQRVRAAGLGHRHAPDAVAYHQWHPSPQPPLQHLADIVRNAHLFHERWNWWPMEGWLRSFVELGLVRRDEQADDWTLVAPS